MEGELICPACGHVTPARKEAPSKLPPPAKVEPPKSEPSLWGCTDLLPPKPSVAPVVELPPDPLPEYISPQQARKWGIRIRMLGEPKK
jgi:hypothetical protein